MINHENIAGKYKILKPLSKGNSGNVYLAEPLGTNREVVIKISGFYGIKSRESSCLKREYNILSMLNHPSLVSPLDFNRWEKGCYLVLEYIKGDNLNLAKDELNETLLLKLMSQLCSVLNYIHDHNIVHHDIKLSNIILQNKAQNPSLKLIDFGLARRITLCSVDGTPDYMAPEVISKNFSKVDYRADLYSLGVVLYELATGRKPYEGSFSEILAGHLTGTHPLPSKLYNNIHPLLEEIIEKMLQKDPARRPESALEVAAKLDELTKEKTPTGTTSRVTGKILIQREKESKTIIRDTLKAFKKQEIKKIKSVSVSRLFFISGESGSVSSALLERIASLFKICDCEVLLFNSGGKHTRGILFEDMLYNVALNLALMSSDKKINELKEIMNKFKYDNKKEYEYTDNEVSEYLHEFIVDGILNNENISWKRPLILCIDDTHLIDYRNLENLLEFVNRTSLSYAPLIVFIIFPEKFKQLEDEDDRISILNAAKNERYTRFIQQPVVSGEKMNEIFSSIFPLVNGLNIFSEYIYNFSNGNPGFILDILQYLENKGFFEKISSSMNIDSEHLEKLFGKSDRMKLYLSMVSELPSKVHDFLENVAVFDEQFSVAQLTSLFEIGVPEIQDCLELLCKLNYLEIIKSSEEYSETVFCFKFRGFRIEIINRIEKEKRIMMHRKILTWLEQGNQSFKENNYSLLAHHARNCGEIDKALNYYLKSAEFNKSRNKLREGLNQYIMSLPLIRDSEKKIKILMIISELLYGFEQYEDAKKYMDLAYKYMKQSTMDTGDNEKTGLIKGDIFLLKAKLLFKENNKEREAFFCAEQAVKSFEKVGNTKKTGECNLLIGSILFNENLTGGNFYRTALENFIQCGYKAGICKCYINLAILSIANTSEEEALDYIRRGFSLKIFKIDPKLNATLLSLIAFIYFKKNNIRKSLNIYQKVFKFNAENRFFISAINNLNHLILIFTKLGKYNEANDALMSAIMLSRKTGVEKILISLLHSAGCHYRSAGNFEKAREFLVQAMDVIQKKYETKDIILWQKLNFNLILTEIDMNLKENVKTCLINLRQIAKANKSDKETYIYYFALTQYYYVRGMFNAFKRVIEELISKKHEDIDLPHYYNIQYSAAKYCMNGPRVDFEKAEAIIKDLKFIKDEKTAFEESNIFIDFLEVECFIKKGMLNEAFIKLDEIAKLIKNTNFLRSQMYLNIYLAHYYGLSGNISLMRSEFEKAIELCDNMGKKNELGQILFQFGTYCMLNGYYKIAAKNFSRAETIFEVNGNPLLLARLYYRIYQLLVKINDTDNALMYLKSVENLKRKFRISEQSLELI